MDALRMWFKNVYCFKTNKSVILTSLLCLCLYIVVSNTYLLYFSSSWVRTLCCQFIWFVLFLLFLRYSLTLLNWISLEAFQLKQIGIWKLFSRLARPFTLFTIFAIFVDLKSIHFNSVHMVIYIQIDSKCISLCDYYI